MTPRRPSPRYLHHVRMRRARCWSSGECAPRRCLSPAQAACEPAVAVREAPRGGTPGFGPAAARARGTGDRALHRVRRPAPRLCPHLLRRLWARHPARVLVQDEVLLPELSAEARTALRGVGRGERARAGAAPPVRVYRPEAPAPRLRPASGVPGGALPHRCPIARRCVRRSGPWHPPGADPVRADVRGSGQLQPAPACACRRTGRSLQTARLCPCRRCPRGCSSRVFGARCSGSSCASRRCPRRCAAAYSAGAIAGFSAHNPGARRAGQGAEGSGCPGKARSTHRTRERVRRARQVRLGAADSQGV